MFRVKRGWLALTIIMFTGAAHADEEFNLDEFIASPEIAESSGEGAEPASPAAELFNLPEQGPKIVFADRSVSQTQRAREYTCYLEKVGWCRKQATDAGNAFAKALPKLDMDPSKFTEATMMHVFAQITSESAFGEHLIEIARRPLSRKGFGYNQVTGLGNLRSAQKCMNKADPGSGRGVSEDPWNTIGRDPYQAALGSLCWWETNIIDIPKHQKYAVCYTEACVKTLTQIANSGEIGGRIVNQRRSLPPRQSRFTKLMGVMRAGTCRNISSLGPAPTNCGYGAKPARRTQDREIGSGR